MKIELDEKFEALVAIIKSFPAVGFFLWLMILAALVVVFRTVIS